MGVWLEAEVDGGQAGVEREDGVIRPRAQDLYLVRNLSTIFHRQCTLILVD
jgi:hypothetical protein